MNNVTFTTGVMGSGKSSTLIKNFNADNREKIAFSASFKGTTGRKSKISSRNGLEIDSINLRVDDDPNEIVYQLLKYYQEGCRVFYFDEVQFLNREIISAFLGFARAKETKVEIHFYGLDSDFKFRMFESSAYLYEQLNYSSERIKTLEMKCEEEECKYPAAFNARLINGKIQYEGPQIVEEKSTYKSLCAFHYFE